MKKFWDSIKSYVYIILVVIIIRTWFVTPAIVNGNSMVPTLEDNEVVIINKLGLAINGINRLDIVVVKNNEGNDKIIKRVIGLPNETIEIINNVIYIDGQELKSNMTFEFTEDFKTSTGEGEYFLLGDNRDISKDSRVLGNFTKNNFIGKVPLRIFPFDKIGFIHWLDEDFYSIFYTRKKCFN